MNIVTCVKTSVDPAKNSGRGTIAKNVLSADTKRLISTIKTVQVKAVQIRRIIFYQAKPFVTTNLKFEFKTPKQQSVPSRVDIGGTVFSVLDRAKVGVSHLFFYLLSDCVNQLRKPAGKS